MPDIQKDRFVPEPTPLSGQCMEQCPIPFQYKGSFQIPLCILEKGHNGKHRTSVAYGGLDWVSFTPEGE